MAMPRKWTENATNSSFLVRIGSRLAYNVPGSLPKTIPTIAPSISPSPLPLPLHASSTTAIGSCSTKVASSHKDYLVGLKKKQILK